MKVVWSKQFLSVYSSDPAAKAGRLEPTLEELEGLAEWIEPEPASEASILRCHTVDHFASVRRLEVYEIAALAAGGAVTAAHIAKEAPCFALVRPPGHHASRDRAWGFCFFNNVAIALSDLRFEKALEKALVLDLDLHYGDGTANILGHHGWVQIVNPQAPNREAYVIEIIECLNRFQGDWIAVSAGFDNHSLDWGGVLHTQDYELIGLEVGIRARALRARCFAALEGGYNPASLAESVYAFVSGLERGWSIGEEARLHARG
jgi:acetoin utilization deacetylase AcuC-like enzyme